MLLSVATDLGYNCGMTSAPAILDRLFDPIGELLTPESARRIVEWRIDEETQQRIDELADKCNEGTLTADEASQYDRYLAAFDIVAVMQAKGRAVIEHAGNS